MSAADKTKLDGVASSATNTPLSATAPVSVTKATAQAGSATEASKQDHKHDISTGTPVAVGTANDEGDGTSLARGNHIHAGLTRGAGDFSVFSEKSSPVSADLLLIEDSAAAGVKKRLQIGNLGSNDINAVHKNTSGEIAGITEKTVPVSADLILLEDSEATNAKKKVQVLNLRRWKQSAFAEVSVDTSTTSGTFVDLLTINFTKLMDASYLIVSANMSGDQSNANQVYYRIMADGVAKRGAGYQPGCAAITLRISGINAGARVIKLQWCVSGGTGRINVVTSPDWAHASLLVEEVNN
jgi:hypothetical protein